MKKPLRTGMVVVLALLLMVVLMYGISTAEGNTVTALSVSPDPIKLGTSATIQYTLSSGGNVFIKVYNSNGDMVRTVVDGVYKNTGSWSQVWDGKDVNSNIVPDGSYKITVEQKDSAGTALGSMDITKTAAVVPVVSALSASQATFNPAVGEQVYLNYTLSTNANVTVTILNGYSTVKTLCANALQNAGPNTIVWDGKDSAGKMAADASYTYQIQAASTLVPAFKSTLQKGTVVLEKEAPQITGYSVNPNPLKLGVNNLSIYYTLSESSKVTLKIMDGTTVKRTLLDGVTKSGSATTTWDGRDDLTALVSEGNYSVVISAIDNANKSSGEKRVNLVAGYQPVITNPVANPTSINPNGTNNKTAISYTLANPALVTVQILSGYSTVKTLVNKVSQSGSPTVEWDGTDSATPPKVVGDGTYSFQITATSPVVSSFTATYKGTVSVEKGAVSITGFSATPNPFKIGTNNPSISYTLSEASTVNLNVYDSNNILVRKLVSGASKNAGYSYISWDGTNDLGQLVDEGDYTAKVSAVDATGKFTEASTSIIGGYVPVVTGLTSSPEPFNSNDGLPVNIAFTLAKPANAKLMILQGYNNIRTIDLPGLLAGANSVEWDGKNTAGVKASDGSYTYKIEATSPKVSTFVGSASGILTVNGSTPKLSGLSVGPATVKIGNDVTFRYTLSEPATIQAWVYDAQGQAVKTFANVSKTEGSYSFIWDGKDDSEAFISPGNYTLRMAAIDNDNIAGTVQLAFQAGSVPTISAFSANPASLDIDKGDTGTTISYNVNVESFVTIKALDASGKFWKNIAISKKVYGNDSVFFLVYENGKAVTGTLGYSIDASSVIGSFKAEQVLGSVVVGGKDGGTGNCTDCHKTYPTVHPMTNCFGCHGNNEPIGNCADCHKGITHSDATALNKYQCNFCHNDTYKYKIPGHGDIVNLHVTTLETSCQECHNQNLTVEHPLHTDINGLAYDCNTCHGSSASQTVKDAVYNNDKSCSACHGEASHQAVHETTNLDDKCTTCHDNNLVDEHMNNPKTQTDPLTNLPKGWNCDTCHSSSDPNVVGALATDNMQCAACHRTAHEMSLVENVYADITLYRDVTNTVYTDGFIWSAPLDASFWAGETWMPDEFIVGGKLLISSRRTDVVAQQVYDFYNDSLTSKGWVGVSPVPDLGSNFFDVSYTKGIHKAKIMFYGGAYHNAAPVVPAGYRIEILYK